MRNVDRHAHADHVEVRVERHADTITLTVSDDGVGFDTAALQIPSPGHVGLISVVDAVEELGGRFAVTSSKGRGCLVEVSLPANGSDLPDSTQIG